MNRTMETTAELAARHAHHWIIDEVRGPESAGLCKSCGAQRVFRNWLPETDMVTGRQQQAA